MGKTYQYKKIRNLKELKAEQQNLKAEFETYEAVIKQDVKSYIHQFTPGALLSKFTRKPKEKVVSAFQKVKSWFSKKKKANQAKPT